MEHAVNRSPITRSVMSTLDRFRLGINMPSQTAVLPYVFDLELSGKCNTVCTFCPRDEMKRGEQFMAEAHFEHFLDKLSRYPASIQEREIVLPHEKARGRFGAREQSAARVILCGMGESLMH